jgi:hypothetical protein
MNNTTHTITLATDERGHTYCTTCGRNVWPVGTTPATGTWPVGTPATTAGHLATSKALAAQRTTK